MTQDVIERLSGVSVGAQDMAIDIERHRRSRMPDSARDGQNIDASREQLHFPVPWARDASISFLISADATRQKLQAAGMRIAVFEDLTQRAFERARERMRPASAPLALGLHTVLGQDAPTMLKNMLRNYEEQRIGLVQGVAVRGS